MAKKKRWSPLQVGMLGIVSVILLLIGLSFLKGYSVLTTTTTLYALFDNARGLKPGDQVLIQGMQVGQVSELSYDPVKRKVVVKFWVQKGIQIPRNSEVEAFAKDFLGTMALALQLGEGDQWVRSGDTLKASLRPDLFDELRTVVYPLKDELVARLKELQPTLLGLQALLGDTIQNRKSAQNLHATIQSLRELTVSLQKLSRSLHDVSEETKRLIQKNQEPLTNTFHHFEQVSRKIANQSETIEQLLCNLEGNTRKLNQLLDSLNQGGGTASRILHDPRLYEYMTQTANDLDRLLVELREHPERFVHFSLFGRRDKKKK